MDNFPYTPSTPPSMRKNNSSRRHFFSRSIFGASGSDTEANECLSRGNDHDGGRFRPDGQTAQNSGAPQYSSTSHYSSTTQTWGAQPFPSPQQFPGTSGFMTGEDRKPQAQPKTKSSWLSKFGRKRDQDQKRGGYDYN